MPRMKLDAGLIGLKCLVAQSDCFPKLAQILENGSLKQECHSYNLSNLFNSLLSLTPLCRVFIQKPIAAHLINKLPEFYVDGNPDDVLAQNRKCFLF
jgi:hypothetical protein